MLEAVFISDLHLTPHQPELLKKWSDFVIWAATNTQSIYILGDFFHAWVGDDDLEDWSLAIAEQLHQLTEKGIRLFFMPGNRDFLIGESFDRLVQWTRLQEPSVIVLGEKRILLVHGDRYCLADKSHQWFRCLTRRQRFIDFFLLIPLRWRRWMVNHVRQASRYRQKKGFSSKMGIVAPVMLDEMERYQVFSIIHGHIHQPGLTKHTTHEANFCQFVLSDWDDIPQLLCYNSSIGFFYDPLSMGSQRAGLIARD